MIYLASPYSSQHEEVRHRRYLEVRATAALLIPREREAVFSPIIYAHEMAREHDIGTDAKTWRRFNMDMLRHASKLYVLTIEGWVSSLGVAEEIDVAKSLGTEIHYIDEFGRRVL